MIFREATRDDLEQLVAVQRDGAVHGLAHIFPQDEHPFPRDVVATRWAAEMADPETDVFVSSDDPGWITGFAAIRGTELLHFGTARHTWGTGLAEELHDRVLVHVRVSSPEAGRLWLRVFEANMRARRFYEILGWTPTGE